MKTTFKGTINGKEFDNVQEYNTEMQRLIEEGATIDAHADTQSIEEPEENLFLFPGFAHCQTVEDLDEAFIDVALKIDADTFMNDVNELLHSRIIPAIESMDEEELESYDEIVMAIENHLKKLNEESDSKAQAAIERLEEIEKELEELKEVAETEAQRKAVIEFVASLYDSIAARVDEAGKPKIHPCDDTTRIANEKVSTMPDYIETIKQKARDLFGIEI